MNTQDTRRVHVTYNAATRHALTCGRTHWDSAWSVPSRANLLGHGMARMEFIAYCAVNAASLRLYEPVVQENNCAVVVAVADDPADRLVDGAQALLVVPQRPGRLHRNRPGGGGGGGGVYNRPCPAHLTPRVAHTRRGSVLCLTSRYWRLVWTCSGTNTPCYMRRGRDSACQIFTAIP
jgi:hypothetical protein